MTSQSLAVIGQIVAAKAIPGADMIHQVTAHCADAGTWTGVAGKDVGEGHRVLVLLQDALLPPIPRWQFMERHHWRVRMARFKGVPSECVILPDTGIDHTLLPGDDVSELLGITKYEKPIPASMGGDAVGAFPSFIPKTDEPNFQTVPELVEKMADGNWYAAEKADGTSCTAWVDDAGLHVCSRNWELREFTATGAQNVYWRAARKYGLERLTHGVALQFEVVGPGIQGNPMGLKDLEARAFSLYQLRLHQYAPLNVLRAVAASLGIPVARLIEVSPRAYSHDELRLHQYAPLNVLRAVAASLGIPVARLIEVSPRAYSHDELRALAAIRYPNGAHAEGVVVRALDSSWSFKVINLAYKG